MAHGIRSPFAEAQPLTSLPGDVLRIILNKIGLEDRLRVELLSKSHRDTLREPELWRKLDLASMQALDLRDEQLLHLLSRVDPGFMFQKLSSQVRGMAEILEDLTQAESFIKRPLRGCLDRMPMAVEAGHVPEVKSLIPFTAILFLRLHRLVPEAWGPTRVIVETCTSWISNQINRVARVYPRIVRLLSACQASLKHPQAFPKTLLASFNGPPSVRLVQVDSAKVDLLFNASGAANLSPAFISACIIALSAAGFKTEFRMEAYRDPLFPLHLVELIKALAVDCSVHVNLLVSGAHFGAKHFLKHFNPCVGDQEVRQEHDVGASLSSSLAAFRSYTYPDSAAAYQRFEHMVRLLSKLRGEIEALAGRTRTCGDKARVLSQTVVIENLVKGLDQRVLLGGLQEYLNASPSKLRLVLRNCRMRDANIRSLCDLLGECGVGHVTYQKIGHIRPWRRMGNSVLLSLGLRNSKDLHTLELDCPLYESDFNALTAFLDANGHGTKIVIHVRRSIYCLDLNEARKVLSKLKVLCSSERGARVTVVHHRGGAPGGSPGQVADSVSTFDDSPFEREVATALKYRMLLMGMDHALFFLHIFDRVACLIYILQRMLVGQAEPVFPLEGAGVFLGFMFRPFQAIWRAPSSGWQCYEPPMCCALPVVPDPIAVRD